MTSLIALLILILAMAVGIPIPLSFFLCAAFICTIGGFNPLMLFSYGFNNQNSILLLTIPLFVLAGAIIDKGGIGEKLVQGLMKLCKGSKAALGTVTIISSAMFGAVSGSATATLSCIGSIMTPRLKEQGYKPGLIGAMLASSGVLGIMIPPSILMILYAWGTGTSVLACFLATIIPGVILITLFSIVNAYFVKKDPDMVNFQPLKKEIKESGERKQRSAVPAVMMPILLLGSIYGGVLTATEGAAFSVIYSLIIGIFYYHRIDSISFKAALVQAGETSGVIMVMLFSVGILSRMFMTENLPDLILNFLTSLSSNRAIILIMINLFMLVIGMLMDDCSGTVLSAPLLLPVVMALGMTPIQFAAVLSVNIGMGNVTPPCAPLLYLGGRVAGADVKEMLKPTFSLILFAWIPTLILTTFVPDLSLLLPRLMGYV
ncbi:TRAP transporter large permease [Oceanispirochaeta crateris]|uniref:TRAP transporter large permease n=1 Tax=Oceanispirochaeta crateris TaxID=2518645 RepID=A0A5C1QQH3_9SPIO|nr:TRAP transporter large permease [Oceanispirochaeta crateris]QEN09618.1 TRAP transporter large permease [Oceanispirochaeta crateris]